MALVYEASIGREVFQCSDHILNVLAIDMVRPNCVCLAERF